MELPDPGAPPLPPPGTPAVLRAAPLPPRPVYPRPTAAPRPRSAARPMSHPRWRHGRGGGVAPGGGEEAEGNSGRATTSLLHRDPSSLLHRTIAGRSHLLRRRRRSTWTMPTRCFDYTPERYIFFLFHLSFFCFWYMNKFNAKFESVNDGVDAMLVSFMFAYM